MMKNTEESRVGSTRGESDLEDLTKVMLPQNTDIAEGGGQVASWEKNFQVASALAKPLKQERA